MVSQWWSFEDKGQQEFGFSFKKSVLEKISLPQSGHQKVPISDFQSKFSLSKILQICSVSKIPCTVVIE